MTNRTLLAATALSTTALFTLAASPALAQTTPPPATTPDTPPGEETTNSTQPSQVIAANQANAAANNGTPDTANIVVTGSRIKRPNLESPIPVTSLQGEQFFQRGQTNIGDALNDLPQLRSTFAQQNPGLGIGIAGLNLLDLRGLGTVRTLVLVNGRRHVAADILNNAVSVDVSSIPADLIDRVDIVTGANSSVYGSDAIAGVVNFILKKDYDGIQVRAQGATTEHNYGKNYYASILAGHNFMGGRANVTVHGEYAHQDRIFASDIPWLRHNDGLGVSDVDPATIDDDNNPATPNVPLPHGTDNFADRIFRHDIRQTSIAYTGLIPITQRATDDPATVGVVEGPACGTGLGTTLGAPSTVGGLPYNCTFVFNEAADLAAQTGDRFSTGIIGGILGGNGTTGREREQFSMLPKLNRINLNLLAHFTVSEAFEPFIEAKWNRVDALGNNAGPSFIQGTFNPFDLRERIRLDNPFLTPTQRTTIATAILNSGCNTSLTASCLSARSTFGGNTFVGNCANPPVATPTCVLFVNGLGGPSQGAGGPLNAADRAAIAAGTYRFVVARNLLDVGIRDENFRRDTWRIVGGARGTFNDDWSYEISANYGRFDETIDVDGFLDKQKFMLSLDAGLNPATGQIQCRSQFDPSAALPLTRTFSLAQAQQEQARLAADIAACVPYNPFGFNPAGNAAAVNYFSYNAHKTAYLSQLDFLGFVNGDSSQLFELPGGPIGFAIGAEYRRERARYDDDDFAQTGLTNGVVIGEFKPSSFIVKEAFGELNVPIFKERRWFYDLSLNAAGRVSDYKGAVGTVWTWNYGGEWAPVRGVRFRGNYGKSVRVPNLSETGFPVVFNFAPNFVDPCQVGAATGNRAINCAADLGPLFPLAAITRSLPVFSGSNPDLQPEVSHSLTLGTVLTPRFLPGASLSVDYYDIKVKDVIVSLTAQAIVNGCYDRTPGTTNVLCSLFTRVGAGGNSIGDLPGWVSGEQANALTSAGQNFASRERKGIDINAGYRTRFFRDWILDTNLIYVHTIKASDFQNPADPTFEDRLLEEVGTPKDEFRLDTDVRIGKLTVGHRLHYIGPMYVTRFEDFNQLDTACNAATNTCPPNDADWSSIRQFPAVWYNDIRLQWDTGQMGFVKNVQVYGGIDNIFDRHPPLGTTATGAGPGGVGATSIYDIRGRNYYAGIKARF
ncbi:MAG TPA: TonB-dependent receptor [Sphingomicrobium sp.]